MAELARGAVTDRPWGRTLGTLAARGLSGQVTVTSDGKPYRIAFADGAVVGASSPLASDAAVRIAMTGGLISSTQVADISRRLAAAAQRDEVDVIAESTKIAPEQAQRLRRRVVAQRAARTFSLEQGDFVIDDRVTVPVVAGAELDVRAVVYLGARNNLSEQRLAVDIDQLGGWFKIKPEAVDDLGQFGFTDTEQALLQQLVEGNNLEELERTFVDLGARSVRAVVYSLASCAACDMEPPRPIPGRITRDGVRRPPTNNDAPAPVVARTTSWNTPTTVPTSGLPHDAPVISRTTSWNTPTTLPTSGSPRAPTSPPDPSSLSIFTAETTIPTTPMVIPPEAIAEPVVARTTSWSSPAVPRTPTPNAPTMPRVDTSTRAKPPSTPPADVARTRTSSTPPRNAPRARRNTAATVETEALIKDRLAMVERDVDHFALLGISRDASPDAIRGAYFTLARKLHPDRLASIGIVEGARDAQRLFAQINLAFAVLNDPARRVEYLSILSRGGESAVRAEDARADELAMRVMHAEEAFRRGEMALRRDLIDQALVEFTTALEMQPDEPEYQALFVWTKFAAAADKQAIAAHTRQQLTRAAQASSKSPTARFYLGRVERILGREREALAHFHEVLQIKPNHSEATSEVRVLEGRLKGKK